MPQKPRTAGWSSKLEGMLFMLLGAVHLIDLASGGRDPLAPLVHLSGDRHTTQFIWVKSPA